MSIFKACDIRGVYGTDLTDDTAYRIGRAAGTMMSGRTLVVGGDVRVSSPALKSALIKGLTLSGVDVIDVGIVPTPAFYFAIRDLNADGGVMVTASHNPTQFNGMKLSLGPLPVTPEDILAVKALTETEAFVSGSGQTTAVDVIPSYKSFILSVAPRSSLAGLGKIILDCGNGCYSDIAPVVFAQMGYEVEGLFCEPDGSFPNRSPNSALAENLTALRERMAEGGAMLGVAFDGDGDRVSFVDGRGRFLSSDKAIVILAKRILADNQGRKVIYDLKCSSVAPESIASAGGIAIPERSGHAFIKRRMITEDAVFGGELSGHYFYRELGGGDDGLYTALLMADMVVKAGMSLAEIADSVTEYATTPDLRVPYEGDRHEIIERIAASFPAECVSRQDGVRVVFRDGWALARVSVTEPVITLRAEATDQTRVFEIMQEFLGPVAELLSGIIHKLYE